MQISLSDLTNSPIVETRQECSYTWELIASEPAYGSVSGRFAEAFEQVESLLVYDAECVTGLTEQFCDCLSECFEAPAPLEVPARPLSDTESVCYTEDCAQYEGESVASEWDKWTSEVRSEHDAVEGEQYEYCLGLYDSRNRMLRWWVHCAYGPVGIEEFRASQLAWEEGKPERQRNEARHEELTLNGAQVDIRRNILNWHPYKEEENEYNLRDDQVSIFEAPDASQFEVELRRRMIVQQVLDSNRYPVVTQSMPELPVECEEPCTPRSWSPCQVDTRHPVWERMRQRRCPYTVLNELNRYSRVPRRDVIECVTDEPPCERGESTEGVESSFEQCQAAVVAESSRDQQEVVVECGESFREQSEATKEECEIDAVGVPRKRKQSTMKRFFRRLFTCGKSESN